VTSGGDPLGGLSPYDLRHLTEHLGSAGRPDQLHRLLWLTAGGPDDRSVRNAWYAAKERIADLDGFLADLDAAWRAAESGSGAVADRLVHQVRCLLLTASVRDFTESLPAGLVPLLVDEGLMPVELALGHTRLMSADDRVHALSDLAVRLPAPDQDRVLPELIELVRGLKLDPGYQSRHVAAAADRLIDPLRAAELVRVLPAVVTRLAAMTTVARRLPGPAGADLVAAALRTARSLCRDHDRDEALAAVAVNLTDPPLILEIAQEINHGGCRARVLAAAAAALPEPRRSEMAAASLAEVDQPWPRTDNDPALHAVAALLPTPQALSAARAISYSGTRIDALAGIADRLPAADAGPVWAEAVAAAPPVSLLDDRVNALRGLATRMPPPQRAAVLAEALALARQAVPDSQGYQGQLLASLVPLLPARDRAGVAAEAVAAARSANNPRSRAWTLTVVAEQLPRDLRRPVLVEALAQARTLEDADERAAAVSTMQPRRTVRAKAAPADRGRPRATAATQLPAGRRPAVVREATEAVDSAEHTARLAVAATGRTSSELPAVRAQAFAAVARRLPPDQRGPALAALLDSIRAIPAESHRIFPLADLAELSPDPGPAVDEALRLAPGGFRARALARVAAHLPAPARAAVLAQATTDAAGEAHPVFRRDAYVTIAVQHDRGDRAGPLIGALRAVPEMDRSVDNVFSLAQLVERFPDTPPEQLYETCSRLLRDRAGERRAAILRDLATLTPVLDRLGGARTLDGAVAAIIQVGQWFP